MEEDYYDEVSDTADAIVGIAGALFGLGLAATEKYKQLQRVKCTL